jgi:hypothetical protein
MVNLNFMAITIEPVELFGPYEGRWETLLQILYETVCGYKHNNNLKFWACNLQI